MTNNLPPGCSSDDGGIDHALEAAFELLCDQIKTRDEAYALYHMLSAIRMVMDQAAKAVNPDLAIEKQIIGEIEALVPNWKAYRSLPEAVEVAIHHAKQRAPMTNA